MIEMTEKMTEKGIWEAYKISLVWLFSVSLKFKGLFRFKISILTLSHQKESPKFIFGAHLSSGIDRSF